MSTEYADDQPPQTPVPRAADAFGWTAAQRRVLIVLAAVLLAWLGYRYASNPYYVSDPQPEVPDRFADLADRIDPNTADWQTLAALPGLGEKRARDVVNYREAARAADPDRVVFRSAGDLLRIRGIGVAMMTGLSPYLIFPTTQPSTTTVSP